MRIGLVTTSYPRFPGDLAGSFVAEHAAFLVRAGHDVEVIAADGPGRAAGAGRSAGSPRVRWVAAPPGLFDSGGAPEALAAGGRSYLAAARFSLALAREVRRRAPGWDAVIAHWLVPGALAAVVGARGLPLLAIAHSGDVHLLRRLRLARAAGALLSRPGVRLSFVTDELRRLFVAGAPGCTAPMQVRSMGVDVARLRAARRALVRAGGPPAVLFLGRLVPVKGADVVIRAAALWRCPARLVVAGAGPLERELRALADRVAPGRVDFVGALHSAERDRALGAADVVALPSVRVEGGRSEGLPMVALEAIASGADVVASAVGGLTELPSEVVTLVPPGDPIALAAAVDRLHLQGSQSISRTAVHDRFALAFDWTSVGSSLLPPPAPSRHTRVRSRKPFRTTA